MEKQRITELKQGDINTFNQVYNEFSSKLYHFIYQKTGCAFYAHEVTQLTFIKLLERHKNLKFDIPLSAQIFQIAKTTLIDVLRKTEKERIKIKMLSDSESAYKTTGYELINEYDTQRKLATILKQMPPVRRKVFSLRIQSQLSYKEIACMLSISVKTVNKHMELASKQVKYYFNMF